MERLGMTLLLHRMNLISFVFLCALTSHATAKDQMLVVVGAGGEPQYEQVFRETADQWEQIALRSESAFTAIGVNTPADQDAAITDYQQLKSYLDALELAPNSTFWLVLIGHGTFFNNEAKFNLRGPDFTAKELDEWIGDRAFPVVLINTASSSSPFLNQLSRPKRIVLTATKSVQQTHFTRFGQYLVEAIRDPQTDLDHDDEVSLLEAFLKASGEVRNWYRDEGRIATEQALLDDNADLLGTEASMFEGLYAKPPKDPKNKPDGSAASRLILIPATDPLVLTKDQQDRRTRLEAELDALRAKRKQLPSEQFTRELEAILMPLSELYHEVDR